MRPVDVKDNAYIDFDKEVNKKDPKFQFGDYVRTSKYKIQFYGHMLLMILILQKLLEYFMKNNCKKQIEKNLGWKK